ncbi:MAG: AraC family transcriptional regulator [Phycisphaerae bacterium]|nr:AraC family transcriptional regulator [Phycisphaerae bacterium]
MKKVRVSNTFVTYCSADWYWDCREGLKDFDLWYVMGGAGWLETPEGQFAISRGDCFIFRPHQRYFGRHDPADLLSVTAIHFDYLDGTGHAFQPPAETVGPLQRKIRDTAFMEQILHRVISAFGDDSAGKSEADEWFRMVLLEIGRCDRQPVLPPRQQRRQQDIDRICEGIAVNPGATHSLAELAGRMKCSPDHFARIFRKYKGLSPGEFIIRSRIEAARTLLLNSSHSITRIAELLGYSDVYYFSKQFRGKTGCTPSGFRRR